MPDPQVTPVLDGWGPDVVYRLERKTPDSSVVVEVPPAACPSCHARWGKPGSVRVGHSGRRVYRCESCTVTHGAQLQVTDPWIREHLRAARPGRPIDEAAAKN